MNKQEVGFSKKVDPRPLTPPSTPPKPKKPAAASSKHANKPIET